jgi:hypothetical protein
MLFRIKRLPSRLGPLIPKHHVWVVERVEICDADIVALDRVLEGRL